MPNALACPPPDVAPSDEGSKLFRRTWWLFFKAIEGAIATILTAIASIAVNSILEDSASGTTVLTTAYQDIGCEVTLDKDGTWLIDGIFDCAVNVQATQLVGQLVVNAVAQSKTVTLNLTTGTNGNQVSGTISRRWKYDNVGSNAAKLQAKVLSTTGVGAGSTSSNSQIIAVFLYPTP